ncbi:MAG: hypothetical protein AAFP81_17490 [Pseudomonadota bacterium]
MTVGAPVRGKITSTSLARPVADSALVLENWFPTLQGARVRGGSALFATIGTTDVQSMFAYRSGSLERIFAANAAAIYDITAPASPTVVPTPAVSGLSSGFWSTVQFETAGGDFLIAVNGTDAPQEYNGSTWAAATLSGTDLTVANLSHVWAFKNRLFFIEDGTMNFWYLGVNEKGGLLTKFSMAGIFKEGGKLLMGGRWSLDAGDGLGDFCVLVSTLGEVAIFKGDNPSDASAWSNDGTYKIARPLGKNAWMDAGGDFLIATIEGIVPISATVNKDKAALSLSAITRAVEPDWIKAVSSRQSLPWDVVRWDSNNLAIVCSPSPSAAVDDIGFSANLETGGWGTLTGWDMHCGVVAGDQLYFGNGSGQILQGDVGGNDNGSLYTCKYAGPFASRNSAYKVVSLMKAFFKASKGFIAQLSVSSDYQTSFPAAPGSPSDATVDEWDSGLWDTAIWDASIGGNVSTRWRSVVGQGDVLSPQIQMSFGVNFKPDVELIKTQMEGHQGNRVT